MLQIASEPLPSRQVQLTIVVPADRLAREIDAVAQEVARKQRIPGYRPGKAPLQRVSELVGEDKLREEAIERLTNKVVIEALRTEALEPVAPVSVAVESEDPLTFRAVVPLPPKVVLGDYHALRIEMPEMPQVQPEDVDAALDEIYQGLAEILPVDRPAEAGDLMGLSLVGRSAGAEGGAGADSGAGADGGAGTAGGSGTEGDRSDRELLFENKDLSLRLSSEDAAAAGIPPKSIDALIGLRPGDSVAFSATYSEMWPEARLQGRAAEFQGEVLSLQAAVPPSPEVAAERLGLASPDELRDTVGAQIGIRALLDTRSEASGRAVDALVDQSEIEYPPALMELEMVEGIAELRRSVERQGYPWESWLAMQAQNQEAMLADIERMAETRIRRNWVMMAFAEAENIGISEAEINTEVNRVLAEMARTQAAQSSRQRPDRDAIRMEIGSRMLFGRAISRLLEIVGGEAGTQPSIDPQAEA
jgi:trigger factor